MNQTSNLGIEQILVVIFYVSQEVSNPRLFSIMKDWQELALEKTCKYASGIIDFLVFVYAGPSSSSVIPCPFHLKARMLFPQIGNNRDQKSHIQECITQVRCIIQQTNININEFCLFSVQLNEKRILKESNIISIGCVLQKLPKRTMAKMMSINERMTQEIKSDESLK